MTSARELLESLLSANVNSCRSDWLIDRASFHNIPLADLRAEAEALDLISVTVDGHKFFGRRIHHNQIELAAQHFADAVKEASRKEALTAPPDSSNLIDDYERLMEIQL
jgi:hypothetical protein